VKTLHLLRHAKSAHGDRAVADHERDLNDRGRRDAPAIGLALRDVLDALPPVYCSTALRARRTLEGVLEGYGGPAAQAPTHDARLYTFDYRELLDWLCRLPQAQAQCLLVGHNPALTELCNQLLGRPALDNLPTAGYLQLRLAVDRWSDIAPGTGELQRWLFPRDLH